MSISDLETAVNLLENGIETKTFSGKQYRLYLCYKECDAKEAIKVYVKNLANNYVKGLYEQDPDYVSEDFCANQVEAKTERNKVWMENARKKLQDQSKNADQQFYRLYFVIKDSDEKIVGSCEMHQEGNKRFQIGVFIDEKESHQGVGTAVVKSCLNFFTNYTNVVIVAWECYADNAASNKLALKSGFSLERSFNVRYEVDANRYTMEIKR